MQEKSEKIITPEGFELKFYERESVEIKLNIPKDVLENLQNIADQKEMSVESVLKFFIGQGLRNELDSKSASELLKQRLDARKKVEETSKIDLAA